MNQNLIQINNNCGAVSDENGNISLIEKENDSHNFEEILLKENEIEELNLNLQESKKKLLDNKQNMISGEVVNACLIVAEVLMYAFLHPFLPLKGVISVMAIAYVPLKGVISCSFGTRIGRHIKKKRLTIEIEKMELDLPKLEKELMEMKEKSKYKVNDSTAVKSETKTSTEEIRPEYSLPIEHNISEECNKVRVLSLSKRR